MGFGATLARREAGRYRLEKAASQLIQSILIIL
jgi:hypothetical protein